MQIFEAEVPCDYCDGKGHYEGDDIEYITDCDTCDGRGNTVIDENISLAKWKINKSRPSPEDCAVGEMDSNGWLRYSSGIIARTSICHRCRNHLIISARAKGWQEGDESLDFSCKLCEGRGRYIVTARICDECEGEGTVPVYNRYDCELCDKTGMMIIEEEREV